MEETKPRDNKGADNIKGYGALNRYRTVLEIMLALSLVSTIGFSTLGLYYTHKQYLLLAQEKGLLCGKGNAIREIVSIKYPEPRLREGTGEISIPLEIILKQLEDFCRDEKSER